MGNILADYYYLLFLLNNPAKTNTSATLSDRFRVLVTLKIIFSVAEHVEALVKLIFR
jgi:hypothetical protein